MFFVKQFTYFVWYTIHYQRSVTLIIHKDILKKIIFSQTHYMFICISIMCANQIDEVTEQYIPSKSLRSQEKIKHLVACRFFCTFEVSLRDDVVILLYLHFTSTSFTSTRPP